MFGAQGYTEMEAPALTDLLRAEIESGALNLAPAPEDISINDLRKIGPFLAR